MISENPAISPLNISNAVEVLMAGVVGEDDREGEGVEG